MLAVLLVGWTAEAAETSGFVEVRGAWSAGVDGVPWQLVERVRPEFEADLGERWLLAATPEASFVQGRTLQDELERTLSESDFGAILDAAGCEWPEPENTWLHVDEASDYLRVDRLYVDTYQPGFDLRIGRQALNWGSALMINPTDPFPEVLFVEPWRPRAGVNSARLTVPIGESHQVQAVAGTDDAFRYGRLAGRGTLNALGTDFSAVGAYRGDTGEGIVGLDVRGTLGVGFWLEGAWHLAEEPYEEIAVGVDYSFPVLENLIVGAQYYRNGGGATDPDDYAVVSRTSQGLEPPVCATPEVAESLAAGEPDPFAPFTVGTDYGLVQIALAATPDVSISAVALQNLRDGTGVGVPVVQVRPGGAFEIAATAQLPYRLWGRTGEFKPAPADLVMSVPSPVGGEIEADLSGLVPDATFIAWTRYHF